MQCFARWEMDEKSGLFFRDQTILQFGDSWDFRATLVLLNPGSALPKNETDQTALLMSMQLPFFVAPGANEKYVAFSIDRLMSDVIKLFSTKYSGGTIRLCNLFNLKNQYSDEAVVQMGENVECRKMFSQADEIKLSGAPVIIGCGANAKKRPHLKKQLIRHIALADINHLYSVSETAKNHYGFVKAKPDGNGFIDSYHLSYTHKYGNVTHIGDL